MSMRDKRLPKRLGVGLVAVSAMAAVALPGSLRASASAAGKGTVSPQTATRTAAAQTAAQPAAQPAAQQVAVQPNAVPVVSISPAPKVQPSPAS
ncbi:hypothetical protein [Streptomyces sp. NPDC008139]|uniref:hypothetical protein n=1 Tax=Streptomyces sp. NPDC008139 TaxID=3364814 RepID=UPI0036F013BC